MAYITLLYKIWLLSNISKAMTDFSSASHNLYRRILGSWDSIKYKMDFFYYYFLIAG